MVRVRIGSSTTTTTCARQETWEYQTDDRTYGWDACTHDTNVQFGGRPRRGVDIVIGKIGRYARDIQGVKSEDRGNAATMTKSAGGTFQVKTAVCPYNPPRAKTAIKLIFCFRGSLSRFNTGIGRNQTARSVAMLKAEKLNQNASMSTQCPFLIVVLSQ